MSADATGSIRLVVFDLGRVLVRICNSWDEACRAGLSVPPGVNINSPELHDLSVRLDAGDLTTLQFSHIVSGIVGFTPEQVHAMSLAFVHGPYPGAAALLDDLHSKGYATACLSNTNDGHWTIMNDPSHATHIPLHRLTHRFASHLIRVRKPDAAIYEHLEKETGAKADSIVFFDDMEVNIAAAKERGWHAHRVDPKSPDPIAFMRGELRGHGLRV